MSITNFNAYKIKQICELHLTIKKQIKSTNETNQTRCHRFHK